MQTACVAMTGPDVRMDLVGDDYYEPANPLPIKCPHCTFPDLDNIAKPYLLTKGVTSPAENSLACLGNFLVRERVRRILELVVPGACTFHPTAESKSKKAAPWWLAVPNRKLETFANKAKSPFCSKCKEPKVWASVAGPVWEKMLKFDSKGIDVFKTAPWMSLPDTAEDDFKQTNKYRKESGEPPLPWSFWSVEAPAHPERFTRQGLDRDLYFSIRLEQLLKRAKVKGQLIRLFTFKEVTPSPDDEIWIEGKLQLLVRNGLADAPKSAPAKTAAALKKWFEAHLKKNAAKKPKPIDFAAVEKRHKMSLPKDYKDFIDAIGQKSYADVNGMEGSTTNVLPPNKLDLKEYRRGKLPYLSKEDSQIDGVMFAATDHGDVFVFDAGVNENDFPVYFYNHEENSLEPFAPNFAECIKRFAGKN